MIVCNDAKAKPFIFLNGKFIPLHSGYVYENGEYRKIYSSDVLVTYYMDGAMIYTEKVAIGDSVLNPTTFTPTKNGWTFIGWKEDRSADQNVLTEKIATGEPLSLYAVFQQTVTLSYDGNGSTSGSMDDQTGNRYYNNGNTIDCQLELQPNGFIKTNHSFLGWDLGNVGDIIELNSDKTTYAQWKEEILDIIASVSDTWGGSVTASDSTNESAPESYKRQSNNCSIPIDITNFSYIIWEGNTVQHNPYGKGNAYIRIGSTVGGTEYANIKVGSHTGESSSSFSKNIDVSGITGDIYVSVHAEVDGTSTSVTSIDITTSSIKAYI